MYLLTYALEILPLGIHSILFNLSPLFTLITTYLILKEKLPNIEVVNMLVSFFGIILVIYGSTHS